MKKIIVILLISGFFSNTSEAQSQFRFGIQASPTFSWMNTNDSKIRGNGTNLGLKLALMGEKYFADNYALMFGLGFGFNQGGTLRYEGEGNVWPEVEIPPAFQNIASGTELKYSIQYLEIPVGIKMRTQEFGYFRYYGQVPITLGIATQAKGSILGLEGAPEGEDIRKAVNFLTFSWGVGGGVEYSVGENIALIGGLNFQTSFVDITRDSGTTFCPDDDFDCAINPKEEDSKAKNNVVTITIGVMF